MTSDSIELLSKILDATALRQRVLANNLANANTPDYKRMDVSFRDSLSSALSSGDPSKISGSDITVFEDTAADVRPDGNSVSMQKEIGEMSENSLLYQFATRAIDRKLETIRKAAKGR